MIILKYLEWDNWFSYGKNNKLDLCKEPLTQVDGVNGAGKSSIPTILEEVLFGKNSRGIKKQDLKNRYSEGDLYAKLVFSINDIEYKIILTRSNTLTIKLYENESDISSHTSTETYKTIINILGRDFKTITQLMYQSSTSSLQFLTSTDANRKKFLISLFNLDNYIRYHETFKEAYKNINKEISLVEGSCLTIQQWIKKHEEISKEKMDILPQLESPDTKVEELGILKSELLNIETTNKKINKNNHYKEALNNLDKEELINTVEKPEDNAKLLEKRTELNTRIQMKNKNISQISSLKEGCPTCHQRVDNKFKQTLLSEYEEQIKSYKKELQNIEENLKKINFAKLAFEKNEKTIQEFEKLSNYIDNSIASTTLDKSDLELKISKLSSDISKMRANITKIEEHNRKAELHNSKINLIAEQIVEYTKQLTKEKDKLVNLEILASNLEVLKNSFGANGLVSYKIESLIKDLEDNINNYLTELSSGRFQVAFTIQGEKLNVDIIDIGKVVSIEALSAGEQGRVNIATLLAIRKLMAHISKSKINLLFLDEIMGVLDKDGKDTLVEILLKEDLNTLVVAHDYCHPLVPTISIIKEDNISRIE